MAEFWNDLARHGDATALVSARMRLSYAELAAAAEEAANAYRSPGKSLVMLGARPDIGGAVHYLGALIAGQTVFLVKPESDPAELEALVSRYEPRFLTMPEGDGYATRRRDGPAYPIHPDLALLLSTSGSVGAPKAVRLSATSLAANAGQIVEALGLTPEERAGLNVPLYFVYGLSVLNSQLKAGASVFLDSRATIDPGLWRDLEAHDVTSFHGVPATFQLLEKLNRPQQLERMTRLTQTGGRLAPSTVEWLLGLANVKMWKMYGMTEAAGRVAVLRPEHLATRPESVGQPVPGGSVAFGPAGEVIYRGPNVMMGYATGLADLGRGDDLKGVLQTADAGHLDADGFLYLDGRMDRTIKLFGLRVELDFVEDFLGAGEVAAVLDGERVRVFATRDLGDRPMALAKRMKVPPHAFAVERIEALPRTGSGKIDYRSLKARL